MVNIITEDLLNQGNVVPLVPYQTVPEMVLGLGTAPEMPATRCSFDPFR